MLQKAIQILSSEVALAQKSDDVAATEKILEVLAA
jgi:RNA polymerase-interacting CarD/CdnL/TRCF family regulator